MCEAEAIINSRPLSVVNLSNLDALSPLTSNHLLTMKTKVVLLPPGSLQSPDKYCRRAAFGKWILGPLEEGVCDVPTAMPETDET